MQPSVTLKVRPKRGFDCRCRVCGGEAKATWEKGQVGYKVIIYCPKCKDNRVLL